MEHSAPSSSLSSSRSSNHQDEKEIVPTSTSQSPIARSATRGMCNVYTLLISSSLFCAFIRLALPRVFSRLSNSNHSNPSPSSSIVPATTDASRPPAGRPYDVFLNHRGPDVKDTLASLLYHFLESVGLRVFLDKEEFQVGDELEPTIQEAIRTASVHVAIFSKTYAESRWCLDELCSMLNSRAIIIPVFYDVQPSDLRWIGKGKSAYDDAFANHQRKRRFDSQMIDMWKAALEEISYRHGLEFHGSTFNGNLYKLCKSIVDTALEAVVNKAPLEVAEYPVGLDEAIQNFENFMQCEQQRKNEAVPQRKNEAVQIVGIVGFGGSGKTTLAKKIYNLQRSSFDKSSFLCDVRHESAKNTLQSLQSQLLRDLVGSHEHNIANVVEGKAILRRRLQSSAPRVLIILDDIDHENQVEHLLAKDVLGMGSLILITSRDEGAITRHSGAASVYKIKPLDRMYARELFCWYAFQQLHPKIGLEDLVEEFCEKCRRLPLFLKVMGAHLRSNGKYDRDTWKEELKYMPDEITDIMRISYNALSTEDKQIFLDVACFFVGKKKGMAIRVWNTSEGRAWTRLRNLENKCLVEVDDKNRLKMHDHLRDFGREIANGNSPYRFWNSNQIISIREQPKGSRDVRGIIAASDKYDDCLTCNSCYENPFGEIKLSGLKLLAIKGNCFESRFGQLSTNLTWLRWYDCPHTTIPSWLLSIQKLTVLQLIGGRLKEWPMCDKQLLLKELKISQTELSNLSIPTNVCPQLECLELSHNECLIEVGHLPRTLLVLRMKYCRRLERISGVFNLQQLKILVIDNCIHLKELPCLKHLSSLETLQIRACRQLQNIGGLEHLPKLLKLDIGGCWELRELPNLSHLSSLEKLQIRACRQLQNIGGLEHLPKLLKLDIGGCWELRELPNLSHLSSLETLYVRSCKKLQNIGGLEHLPKLLNLDIDGCWELRELPNLSHLSSLETLQIRDCRQLQNIGGLEHLPKLLKLDIDGCWELRELPNLSHLSSLETLYAWDCRKLKNIPGLEHLLNLQNLGISDCCELCELPDLSDLISLETLEAGYCIKLQKIQGLEHLQKLQKLDFRGCSELREVPDLSDLSSLERFEVGGCSKLPNIPGLEHQRKLLYLDIAGCCGLHELPSLSDLNCLKTLQADGCWKLQDMHGLDQLEQLTLFKLSAAGYNRALLNSVQQFQKLPSTLFLSGIGDGSKDFSFLHVPVIELEFSAEDDWYQYWTSKIFEWAEDAPSGAVVVCFVVHCSHVGGAAPKFRVKLRPLEKTGIHEILTVGDATPDLRSTMKTDCLSAIVGEGEWRCVGVFSQLMNSRPTTSSTYRMEVEFPKRRMHGLQVEQGWMATVSQGNEAQILEIIDKLFAP